MGAQFAFNPFGRQIAFAVNRDDDFSGQLQREAALGGLRRFGIDEDFQFSSLGDLEDVVGIGDFDNDQPVDVFETGEHFRRILFGKRVDAEQADRRGKNAGALVSIGNALESDGLEEPSESAEFFRLGNVAADVERLQH